MHAESGYWRFPARRPCRDRARPSDRCRRDRGGHDRAAARRHDRDRLGSTHVAGHLDGKVGGRDSNGRSVSTGDTIEYRVRMAAVGLPLQHHLAATPRPRPVRLTSIDTQVTYARGMVDFTSRTVVIVDAVRTPIGRRGGGLSSLHPAEVLARVQSALIDRSGIDPARGRSGRRWMREPGGRAELQRHPYGVAVGRTAARDGRDHGRHPVRFEPAGHQSR